MLKYSRPDSRTPRKRTAGDSLSVVNHATVRSFEFRISRFFPRRGLIPRVNHEKSRSVRLPVSYNANRETRSMAAASRGYRSTRAYGF